MRYAQTELYEQGAANSSPDNSTLLQPGHNCWRVEEATKLQFLIDGEEYFSALRSSLRRAQHSVYILGWDIDSRVSLPRNNDEDHLPEALAPFLDELARSKRNLQIYVLSWDYALLFALEREWLPILPLQWRTHRRVHFRLDSTHPVGASHHQKLVVIDDAVAFVGGIDITRCRWDTSQHEPANPLRRDADGKPYSAFHDVQAIVEGPVAAALGDLAKSRWERATRRNAKQYNSQKDDSKQGNSKSVKQLKPDNANSENTSPWPPYLEPAIENIRIAIARTEPPFLAYPECFEIRNFYLDAIDNARHTIFFENQYFSSNAVAIALNKRLQEPDGPNVVVITPQRESGWLEENTMGLLRARLYAQLKSNANSTRFHPYSPLLADGSCLNVHSKLMTVDDELLTLGSANVSNRSMSLDTECNLIIEAKSHGDRADEVRAAIALLRNRLLAEHLDCDVETVAATQQQMNLVDAIESLRKMDDPKNDVSENDSAKTEGSRRRTMVPSETLPTADNILITDAMLVDPEIPLKPEHVIANYIAPRDRKSGRRHATLIGIAVIIFAALILLWRETPIREYLNVNTALELIKNIQHHPWSPFLILAIYVVSGFIFIPVVVLIAATGAVFGPWLGFTYALAGSLLSAAATFWIGSRTGTEFWRRLFRGRTQRLQARLQKHGVLAVAMVRAMPIAPFTVVNLIAGAAQIRWRDFLLGTLIGMLPGIMLTILFVDRASAALRKPTLASVATFIFTMGIIVATSLVLQHWLRSRSEEKPAVAEKG